MGSGGSVTAGEATALRAVAAPLRPGGYDVDIDALRGLLAKGLVVVVLTEAGQRVLNGA